MEMKQKSGRNPTQIIKMPKNLRTISKKNHRQIVLVLLVVVVIVLLLVILLLLLPLIVVEIFQKI